MVCFDVMRCLSLSYVYYIPASWNMRLEVMHVRQRILMKFLITRDVIPGWPRKMYGSDWENRDLLF